MICQSRTLFSSQHQKDMACETLLTFSCSCMHNWLPLTPTHLFPSPCFLPPRSNAILSSPTTYPGWGHSKEEAAETPGGPRERQLPWWPSCRLCTPCRQGQTASLCWWTWEWAEVDIRIAAIGYWWGTRVGLVSWAEVDIRIDIGLVSYTYFTKKRGKGSGESTACDTMYCTLMITELVIRITWCVNDVWRVCEWTAINEDLVNTLYYPCTWEYNAPLIP